MSASEPKAPEQQGCGDWKQVHHGPAILTSPKPEPHVPSNEGCGSTQPVERPTDTAHEPNPVRDQSLPGCGGMDQVSQKPKDFILQADYSHGAKETWTDKNGDTWAEGDLSGQDVRFNENNKGHIFDNRPGHLIDTPENRIRINDLVKDPTKYLGDDKHGNWWYGEILPDGTQLWGEARGNVIRNCGINEVPQEYNPDSGLCSFDPSKQKKDK